MTFLEKDIKGPCAGSSHGREIGKRQGGNLVLVLVANRFFTQKLKIKSLKSTYGVQGMRLENPPINSVKEEKMTT